MNQHNAQRKNCDPRFVECSIIVVYLDRIIFKRFKELRYQLFLCPFASLLAKDIRDRET